MSSRPIAFGFILCACMATARADIVLYDGSTNTTPDAQGWKYVTNPLGGASATETAGGGATTLDTTAVRSDQAGYFSKVPLLGGLPNFPTLDRAAGFTVRVDARVVAESHASNDRAGFSLIVLGQDAKGIELGFWGDQVWAQSDNPRFTHAEGAAFDTTAARSTYELAILGDVYTLFVGGAPLLSGPVRDYSSFGFPYNSTSFLFLGDDTSSASARVELARVGVTLSAVPEPGGLALLGLGIGCVAWRVWCRSGGPGGGARRVSATTG